MVDLNHTPRKKLSTEKKEQIVNHWTQLKQHTSRETTLFARSSPASMTPLSAAGRTFQNSATNSFPLRRLFCMMSLARYKNGTFCSFWAMWNCLSHVCTTSSAFCRWKMHQCDSARIIAVNRNNGIRWLSSWFPRRNGEEETSRMIILWGRWIKGKGERARERGIRHCSSRAMKKDTLDALLGVVKLGELVRQDLLVEVAVHPNPRMSSSLSPVKSPGNPGRRWSKAGRRESKSQNMPIFRP